MARTKGSVTHCGHCGEAGHTRRTCPDISVSNASKRRAPKKPTRPCKHCYSTEHSTRSCPFKPAKPCKYCGSTNSEHKESECYHRPYRRPVTCSHCCEKGHNKTGCKTLKADREAFHAANGLWRQALVKTLNEEGLGIGTLVTTQETVYDDHVDPVTHIRDRHKEKVAWLIVGFNWDNANCFTAYDEHVSYEKKPQWLQNIKVSLWRCQETNEKFFRLLRCGAHVNRSGRVNTSKESHAHCPSFDRDGQKNIVYNYARTFVVENASFQPVDPPSDYYEGKTTFEPYKKLY